MVPMSSNWLAWSISTGDRFDALGAFSGARGDQLGAGWRSAIGRMASDTSRSRKALTVAELATKDAKGQRLSSLGVFWETQRASGFEPPTSSLGSWHSTTELRPQVLLHVHTQLYIGP